MAELKIVKISGETLATIIINNGCRVADIKGFLIENGLIESGQSDFYFINDTKTLEHKDVLTTD